MLGTMRNAWKIPELRKRILFTITMLLVYRIGAVIPVPFINPEALQAFLEAGSSTIFGYVDVLTGGAFSEATIFAMSITPYITASIIIQLLTVAIPALERIAKQGDEGRKKLAQYTRYATVVIGLIQGFGLYAVLRSQYGAITPDTAFTGFVIVLTFTAGTAFLMWLGEQINDRGIGNGISMILFAGIISRGPAMVASFSSMIQSGAMEIWMVAIIAALTIVAVMFVVFMNNAERRIPVQYAKRVVGRKMYGGQNSHIPLKVTMTGVLPIIFAGSICTLPATIAMFFPAPEVGTFWYSFQAALQPDSILYAILYFLLILFFNFFYTAMQFNPVEIANNIKNNGGFIPGLRPGKPTSDFIKRSLGKITVLGAMFLGVIAVLPILMSGVMGLNFYLGGTSLLIVVGVALETVKQMESQMLMRHYKGFLE